MNRYAVLVFLVTEAIPRIQYILAETRIDAIVNVMMGFPLKESELIESIQIREVTA